jgi:hypothetical protein
MPERSRNSEDTKDPLAVELGRRGGLKGGKARAAKLTKEERVESARKAAQARWAKHQVEGPAYERAPKSGIGRGEIMTRARPSVLAAMFLLAGALALSLVLLTKGSSSSGAVFTGKPASESAAEKPGLGPNSYEAYLQAARAYPANTIPVSISKRAKATFAKIARADARALKRSGRRHLLWSHGEWKLFGPRVDAVQPGVTSFAGSQDTTASRVTALIADPDCTARKCRLWTGVSGGGVWTTANALAPNPEWHQLSPRSLNQNSVGALTLVPGGHGNGHGQDTLYLGTGEGNRCSSGCEAGVGIYKSTNGGESWHKLGDRCVSNATYSCATPGQDSFLGRGINSIVVDPTNRNHILVGSALAVRGLSHVIGNGGTTRFEPGANAPGVYESFDGGNTFTEVWNGNSASSFGVTKVALDPADPTTVYASAFDQGLWRRSPSLDGSATAFDFHQVFAPQFPGGGTDRTMFALTRKSGNTRIYLTDGTANGAGISGPLASNFWRTDNGNQPAAALLASQAAGMTPPPDSTVYPQTYTGWQNLTSKTTGSPYFATDDFCTGQCWYDSDVYTPAGMPDTVYVFGSNLYGEQPCDTKGVGCGNGRSNGREVLYSTTAGDPDGTANSRTFTDLSYDHTERPATWCAYAPYFPQGCLHAWGGIHPDQHALVVNPGNPSQIFEGSDGGIIRTSGTFTDASADCDSPFRNGGGPLPPSSGSYAACKRLLSRIPVQLDHINKKLSSTLQFINVAINPSNSREVMGGTQDNGTWSNIGNSRNLFTQVIYGDGGNAVYDGTEPTWRANEFTSCFGDSNFENGEPTKWVIATGPIVASGERCAFYWPQTGDPNPAPGTHPIYNGAQHVWRSWAFGAGTPGQVPQDTTPNIADYETNCPEFVTSGANPACGDYMPLGGPAGSDQPGDLTGIVYGADRTGGSISWMARDGADHGTMWVATSAGRIFVTHNVDASDPATVTWTRVDSSTSGNSPTRFPSGIYVDPANPGHAWISYSGYNAVTPTTPGHVFSVMEDGTFTNLNVESGSQAFDTPFGDGDLPVSDIVRDDATHTLYVGTDFGVLQGTNDGANWHVTRGMPRYEIMHLAIQPSNRDPVCMGGGHCRRILYAATHSQGFWKMNLGG